MKIIFLGTPDFAVASLQAIIESGFEVAAVVTAPDKPAGRGMQLQQSPVKKFAVERNLPVLQPAKLRDPQFAAELKSFNADLFVVIAFRMLPESIWTMPPLGTINLHASLLPDYRGAAPINWAIIKGETRTGVSTFFLRHEIDTGDVIMRAETPITEDMTAGELHDTLMELGASVIVETLKQVRDNSVTPTPQGPATDKVAPKIFTEDCEVDWSKPCHEVYNLVRGMSPYPGAFTWLDDKMLKIYKARPVPKEPNLPAGDVDTDGKTYLRFACADGWLEMAEIQPQGKKKNECARFFERLSESRKSLIA